MSKDVLSRLGVGTAYHDVSGRRVEVPAETRERLGALLEGFGEEERPAKASAYLPPALQSGGKLWGVAVQLYALRSVRNWGMGDFTDLAAVVRWAEDLGAAYVGVNPLHALFLAEPDRRSPYSPSSRLFLNPLYIDADAMPGAPSAARRPDALNELIEAARAGEHVDYDAVALAKRDAFEAAHAVFLADESRQAPFEAFREQGGAALERHALFEALADHHTAQGAPGGFYAWEEAYHDPDGQAVRDFAAENAARVTFHAWLQWVAHEQLLAASTEKTTLYLDLAVGASPDGSEVWSGGDAYARGVKLGAPPDPMAQGGQDWGLAPLNPKALASTGYEALRAVLRSSMRYAGALRIDHVLGYARQFWIPQEMSAKEGGYVAFPRDGMIAVTAQESAEAECLTIGEDLGTVPEGLTEALQGSNILSYTVARWARDEDGFWAADDYPRLTLAVTSTHDIAPIAGWLSESDIAARAAIEPEGEEGARRERTEERENLLRLWDVSGEDDPRTVVVAAHRFMAGTDAAVVMVALEDLLLQETQVNMPGTTDEHPNWRVRYARTLEDWTKDEDVRALAMAASR